MPYDSFWAISIDTIVLRHLGLNRTACVHRARGTLIGVKGSRTPSAASPGCVSRHPSAVYSGNLPRVSLDQAGISCVVGLKFHYLNRKRMVGWFSTYRPHTVLQENSQGPTQQAACNGRNSKLHRKIAFSQIHFTNDVCHSSRPGTCVFTSALFFAFFFVFCSDSRMPRKCSVGPDQADSLSTTHLSHVGHSSNATRGGGTCIWTCSVQCAMRIYIGIDHCRQRPHLYVMLQKKRCVKVNKPYKA